jgi:hypothetical protein
MRAVAKYASGLGLGAASACLGSRSGDVEAHTEAVSLLYISALRTLAEYSARR